MKSINTNEEQSIYEYLFDRSPNGIALIKDNVFVQCNQKMIEIVGTKNKKKFLNTAPEKIFPQWHQNLDITQKNDSTSEEYETFEWEFKKSKKETLWLDVNITCLQQEEMVYLICKDITERKEMELTVSRQKEDLFHKANYDFLTKLPNREMFMKEFDKCIKEKIPLALLYMDLDRFKDINDSLGHNTGDRVIQEIATRLKVQINRKDFIARLGGDSFVIILENVKDRDEIIYMVDKLQNCIKKPIQIDNWMLYTTASIGISMCPQDDNNVTNLLKFADTAMYKAKEKGDGEYEFYVREMTQVAYKQTMMERDLRNAVKHDEFIVYYQPQVDAITEKVIGMEALVRWNHPTLGLLAPSRFIPIAIKTGLIVDIDLMVMNKAMSDVQQWINLGLDPGVLSLNLTMKQLEQPHIVETIKERLEHYGLRAGILALEITEDVMTSRPDEIIAILKELSYLGITIAIDDFGTGYSSLSYLKRMPIDKLKIDKSFIHEIPYDEEAIAIVEMIIALTNTLQIDVIAEGVETEEQKKFLNEKCCYEIQGYYYSKPLCEPDMRSMLEKEVLDLG